MTQKEKVVPWPSWLEHLMEPLIASHRDLDIFKPRPDPPNRREMDAFPCLKLCSTYTNQTFLLLAHSKTRELRMEQKRTPNRCSIVSGDMPIPISITSTDTMLESDCKLLSSEVQQPSLSLTTTVTVPPSSVNFIALEIKLNKICLSL